MRYILSLPAVITATLLLTGCSVNGLDPSPMGRGYSSYAEKYKSPPARPFDSIGYDYSEESNEAVLKDMHYVAKDLVEKLDEKILFKVERLYLKPLPKTAFYNAFDHVLRDELTRAGYILENGPQKNALPLTFVAQREDAGDATYAVEAKQNGHLSIKAKNREDYENMILSLIVGNPEDEGSYMISGLYEVPAYTYARQNGIPKTIPVVQKSIPVDTYQR
ncbi:MAG: hypothetical protein KDI13_01835 [Alphaproteobacteria bacterium]|nr:hypothetical protein [Alphaproteobacteria bacterium]